MANPAFMVDLHNMQFTRWTVNSFSHSNKKPKGGYNYYWNCTCACGNTSIVNSVSLIYNKSRSCGCLQRDGAFETPNRTHGMSKSETHKAWKAMKSRCKYAKLFPNHAGKGIKVCERWEKSFTNFLEDMGKKPDGMTLDRIDNHGDYTPSNCRWATLSQQARNKCNTTMVEIDGVIKSLADWCEDYAIDYLMVKQRISSGWDHKLAFTTPKLPNGSQRPTPPA